MADRNLVFLKFARLFLLSIGFILCCIPAFSQKKVALVIGNASYADVPLRNPVNDATDLASTLRNLGFTVTLRTNLNKQSMESAVNTFKDAVSSGDVALFYYSGHGMQVSGSNYLIPVGEVISDETDVKYKAVDAQYVMDKLQWSGASVNIIILDACRDNPFRGARTQTKGFVAVNAPQGTVIAYSTAPNMVALDGSGRNSPYTSNLIACIQKPGLEIMEVFREVRKNVVRETSNRQTPWESTSLLDPFSLTGMVPKPATVQSNPTVTEERAIIQYGKAEITTEIVGALYVDGTYQKQVSANTLFTVNNLAEGIHTIKISGDETVEKSIHVAPNQTAHLTIDKRHSPTAGQPCPGMPSFTDPRDGHVYPTVQIGYQCWMQKNMNYQTCNSWCYDNNSSNCSTYGRLYDWQTALKVCPKGWHIPTDGEWCILTQFIDQTVDCGSDSWSGTNVGWKMKEIGTTHWAPPNSGVTNISGFTALPGGYRSYSGSFYSLTLYAYFWSSTENSSTDAWGRNLDYNYEDVNRPNNDKTYGFSCRCLQD